MPEYTEDPDVSRLLTVRGDPAPPPTDPDVARLVGVTGMPEWRDERLPEETRMRSAAQFHMQRGTAANEDFDTVAGRVRQSFPRANLSELRTQYENHRQLEAARRRFANRAPSQLERLLLESVPVVSAIGQFGMTTDYNNARRRFEAGNPEPGDFTIMARQERLHEIQAGEGTDQQIERGLRSVPAMVGEAALSGGIAGRIGLGATSLAGRAAGYAGRTAGMTALMPSMYAPQWAERNVENRREPYDLSTLPSTFAHGMMATAVLGSLGGVGNSITGAGVLPIAKRIMARTATGMVEQGAVDVMASAVSELLPKAYKLETGYGLLGAGLRGDWGSFTKHALVQAVTFAAFSTVHEAMHGAPKRERVLQSLESAIDYLKQQNVPKEQIGRVLEEAQRQGPENVPEGPIRDHVALVHELMQEGAHAAAERQRAGQPVAEAQGLPRPDLFRPEGSQSQPSSQPSEVMPPATSRHAPGSPERMYEILRERGASHERAAETVRIIMEDAVRRQGKPLDTSGPGQVPPGVAEVPVRNPREQADFLTRATETARKRLLDAERTARATAKEAELIGAPVSAKAAHKAAKKELSEARRDLDTLLPRVDQARVEAAAWEKAQEPTKTAPPAAPEPAVAPKAAEPPATPPAQVQGPHDPVTKAGEIFGSKFKDHLVNTGRDVIRAELKDRWVEIAEGQTPDSVRLDFGWLGDRTGRGNRPGDQNIMGDIGALVREFRAAGVNVEYVAIGGRERGYAAAFKRGGYEQIAGPTGEGGELRVWRPKPEAVKQPTEASATKTVAELLDETGKPIPIWKRTGTVFDGDTFQAKDGNTYKVSGEVVGNLIPTLVVTARNANGEIAGEAKMQKKGARYMATGLDVEPAERRKGIAQAMYDWVSDKHGQVMRSDYNTESSRGLWENNQKATTEAAEPARVPVEAPAKVELPPPEAKPSEPSKPQLTEAQRQAELKKELRIPAAAAWNEMRPNQREAAARALKAAGIDHAAWSQQWLKWTPQERSEALRAKPEVKLTAQETDAARKGVLARESQRQIEESPLPPELDRQIEESPFTDQEKTALRETLKGNSLRVIGEMVGLDHPQKVKNLIQKVVRKWGGDKDSLERMIDEAAADHYWQQRNAAADPNSVASMTKAKEEAALREAEIDRQILEQELKELHNAVLQTAKLGSRDAASVRLEAEQALRRGDQELEARTAGQGNAPVTPKQEAQGPAQAADRGQTDRPTDAPAEPGGGAAHSHQLIADAALRHMADLFKAGDGYNLRHYEHVLRAEMGFSLEEVKALKAEARGAAGSDLPPLQLKAQGGIGGQGSDPTWRANEARHSIRETLLRELDPERTKDVERVGQEVGVEAGEVQGDLRALAEESAAQTEGTEATEGGGAPSGRREPVLTPEGELFDEYGKYLFRGEPATGGVTPGPPGLPAAPSRGERRAGSFGGGQEGAEETVLPQKETALANAQVDRERAARDLPPLMSEMRKANAVVWDQAMAILDANPRAGEDLTNNLASNPRPTTDVETALLLQRRVSLSNERERAVLESNAEFRKPKEQRDEAKIDRLDAQERSLAAQNEQLDRVLRQVGTEAGRAFQFRRQMAAEDYSLTRMLDQAERAKGERLTDAERAEIISLHEKIKELQDKLAGMEDAGKVKPGAPSDTGFELVRAKAKFSHRVEASREANAPWHVKAFRLAGEAINLPRAIMASIDFPLLRQGLVAMATHPVRTAKAVPEMVRAFFSEGAAERSHYEVSHRPNALLYEAAGLDLTSRTGPLSKHEEGFLSRLIEKVPVLGHITKASERSYQTVLNRIRADSFDAMVSSLSQGGKVNSADAKVIANYVNVMTGRGPLGAAQPASTMLNYLFFAPKWAVSRFQMLLGQPLYFNFSESAPRARKLVATEYARLAGGLGLMAGLAVLAGFQMEQDPRSSDFGKLKVGNTRLDLTGGLASTGRFLAQTMTLSTKDTKGQIHPLSGQVPYVKDNYADVMARFLRGKLAPAPGAALNLLSGTDVVGQPVTPASAAGNLVTPLFAKDVYEAMMDLGFARGTAVSLLGLLGMGMNTFNPNAPRPQAAQPLEQRQRLGMR